MNETSSREKALLETIRRGLQLSAEHQMQAMLGDRSAYIGMSDIGRYAECPRAAVASKLYPQSSSLERLLTLQRGHWFERGVGDTLEALDLAVLSQLEIRHNWQKTPIRAHLDFTLVWTQPMPAVRILEVKSMETIPDNPHDAHRLQIQGQICLLRKLWNDPVFTLRDESGTIRHKCVTFAYLCRSHFGLEMPANPRTVSIEGWILCLSMKEARAFGPYEFEPDALEQTLWLARDCWRDMEAVRNGALALNDVPHAQGYHPLCTACEYNADCPKFRQGSHLPQWNAALVKLEELKTSRAALDRDIKEMEAALRQAHQLSGTKDWISTGQYRFRTATIAGRRTLDRDAVCRELEALCVTGNIASIDMPALFQRHEREGAPSTRLSITPIN